MAAMPIAVILARNTLNVIPDPSFTVGITSANDLSSMPSDNQRGGLAEKSKHLPGFSNPRRQVWRL
jgi:hypothetical protein